VFDTTFADREFVLTTRVFKTFAQRSYSMGIYFSHFRQFHESSTLTRAYYALYLLINRSLPTLGAPTSSTLTVSKARVMLSSLFIFPNIMKGFTTSREKLLVKMTTTCSVDVNELLDLISKSDDKKLFETLLNAARDFKTMAGAVHSAWSLFGWISRASLVQIGAFLKAMGMSENLFERCCDSFFAVPNRDYYFSKAVTQYEKFIEPAMAKNDYSPLITIALHEPDFELQWLRTNFWLTGDKISIQFDNRSERMPVIATCSRSLMFPICVTSNRVNDVMEQLLASANSYELH